MMIDDGQILNASHTKDCGVGFLVGWLWSVVSSSMWKEGGKEGGKCGGRNFSNQISRFNFPRHQTSVVSSIIKRTPKSEH